MLLPMRLLMLFIGVPLLDLYLLLQLAEVMGGAETVLLVVVTGVLGASMSRLQGARVKAEWQNALQQGRMPEDGVLGGAMWLLGSALLITPGVLTDVAGLLMLLPLTRRWLVRLVRPMVQRRIMGGGFSRVVQDWDETDAAGDAAGTAEWLDVPEGFVSGGVVRVVSFGSGGSPSASQRDNTADRHAASRLERSFDGKSVIDADFEVHPD
jgi:UPF0716 protein FxsA